MLACVLSLRLCYDGSWKSRQRKTACVPICTKWEKKQGRKSLAFGKFASERKRDARAAIMATAHLTLPTSPQNQLKYSQFPLSTRDYWPFHTRKTKHCTKNTEKHVTSTIIRYPRNQLITKVYRCLCIKLHTFPLQCAVNGSKGHYISV